jgi:hypothetical protein
MEIEETFNKLKPIVGKEKLESLWMEYLLYPEQRREIEGIAKALTAKYLDENYERKKVFLVPPSEEVVQGEYSLGTVFYGDKPIGDFGVREEEWIQHIGIFGRTGSGKTNVAFLLIKNLFEKQKPFLIFDWKRNYRDLLSLESKSDLLVFTVGRDVAPFYFNPLIPPEGTLPTVWLKKLIEIMCHAYYLGEGVAFLLQKAIDSVFRETNIYGGSAKYPTLLDVKKWLENYKARGREARWMDSALRLIGTLCYGEMGRILNSSSTNRIDEILEKNVVFELDALTNADKIFFIESLILWIHHFRLQEEACEKFKHAILIEEAHHILFRKKQSKESIMDTILREIRELGESIVLIDQHPSLISIPSLGNTNCTIAMSLKHGLDVNAISTAMLLQDDQREYLGMLETGSGIVRVQNRVAKPFLVKFPHFRIQKGSVTDEETRRKMAGYSGNSADILPDEMKSGDIRAIREEDKSRENNIEITEDEKALLIDILDNPISGIAERFKRLSFSIYKGNRAKDIIISKGIIESHDIPTFKGRIKYLDITEKGKNILRKMGYSIERKRQGGHEHEYWKHRIGGLLKTKGYQVEIEKPIGEGKTVDIVATKDGANIAVEIETGKSDVEGNIFKNIGSGFSEIIIVPLNTKSKRKIMEDMKGMPPGDSNKIEVLELGELFKMFSTS